MGEITPRPVTNEFPREPIAAWSMLSPHPEMHRPDEVGGAMTLPAPQSSSRIEISRADFDPPPVYTTTPSRLEVSALRYSET